MKKNVKPPRYFPNITNDTEHSFDGRNALGFLCGKTNNVIVIDVDSISDWQKLLDEVDEQEPSTVKQTTANGDFHLFFKYKPHYNIIKGKDHYFGPNYTVDVQTNGKIIYVDPT